VKNFKLLPHYIWSEKGAKMASEKLSAIKQDLRDGHCPDDCPYLGEECEYCDYLEALASDEADERYHRKVDRELEDKE